MSQLEEAKAKLRQNPQLIIDKNFKKGLRGYKQSDVDKYLDTIIEDYYTFENVMDALINENQKLKLQIEELKQKQAMAPTPSNMNMDIIQRLNNLERHVFGDRLQEETQK